MGYPQQPHDPYRQTGPQYPPQQPFQQPHGQPYMPPPPPQMPRKVTAVHKERGLSAMSHMTHLMLTIFTCGIWGAFVWLPWWIFRMIFRKKRKTTYYYR